MAQVVSPRTEHLRRRRVGPVAAFCRADVVRPEISADPWLDSVVSAHHASRRGTRLGLARARALLGVAACVVMALAYAGVSYWIVASLHIGHVVQDGIDTGDMLAVPPLVMSLVSVVLATSCLHRFETLGRR